MHIPADLLPFAKNWLAANAADENYADESMNIPRFLEKNGSTREAKMARQCLDPLGTKSAGEGLCLPRRVQVDGCGWATQSRKSCALALCISMYSNAAIRSNFRRPIAGF